MKSLPQSIVNDNGLDGLVGSSTPTSASARSLPRTGADVGGQGGGASNTHLANRRGRDERETGGEDTLIIGLGVKWGRAFGGLMSRFDAGKECAKQSHKSEVVSVGEHSFLVRPSGSSSGGGKGTHYAYVLESWLGLIKFAKQCEPHKETPNVIIEVGSLQLMTGGGALGVWEAVLKIVDGLGGVVLFDKVSRVDICVDFAGVDVAGFYDLIDGEQYACRARKQDFHKDGVRKTGVTLGAGGDIVARVYDKVYEVTEVHPDPAKKQLLEQRRWGGPQDKATRVEFQLRREALRSLGVDSVADYFRLRAEICEYLTGKWLRILEEKPDRENNNTQRTAPHALWLQVVEAFRAFAGKGKTVVQRTARLAYGDPVRLVKQAAGCLMAAVAQARDGAMLSARDFVQSAAKCVDFVVTEYGDAGFYERYSDKAARVSVLALAR